MNSLNCDDHCIALHWNISSSSSCIVLAGGQFHSSCKVGWIVMNIGISVHWNIIGTLEHWNIEISVGWIVMNIGISVAQNQLHCGVGWARVQSPGNVK